MPNSPRRKRVKAEEEFVCVWHSDNIHGQHCPDFKKDNAPPAPSPLPWCMGGNSSLIPGLTIGSLVSGKSIGIIKEEIDAAYIVKACNLFPELVELLLQAAFYVPMNSESDQGGNMSERIRKLLARCSSVEKEG